MSFKCKEDFTPSNIMDRWILSFTQSLVAYVRDEMASELLGPWGRGARDGGERLREERED